MNQRAIRRIPLLPAIAVSIAAFLWWLGLQFVFHETIYVNVFELFYQLVFLASLYVGLYALPSTGTSSAVGKALLLFGLGIGSWGVGSIIWVIYYNMILHVEVPYPSVADVFFLLLIPCMIAGVWQLLSIVQSRLRWQNLAESVGILALSCVLLFGVIYRPDVSSGLPDLAKLFNILHPLGDAILLVLTFMLWRYIGGKLKGLSLLLIIALLSQITADSLFSIQTTNETYANGGVPDLFWLTAGCFFLFFQIQLFNTFVAEHS